MLSPARHFRENLSAASAWWWSFVFLASVLMDVCVSGSRNFLWTLSGNLAAGIFGFIWSAVAIARLLRVRRGRDREPYLAGMGLVLLGAATCAAGFTFFDKPWSKGSFAIEFTWNFAFLLVVYLGWWFIYLALRSEYRAGRRRRQIARVRVRALRIENAALRLRLDQEDVASGLAAIDMALKRRDVAEASAAVGRLCERMRASLAGEIAGGARRPRREPADRWAALRPHPAAEAAGRVLASETGREFALTGAIWALAAAVAAGLALVGPAPLPRRLAYFGSFWVVGLATTLLFQVLARDVLGRCSEKVGVGFFSITIGMAALSLAGVLLLRGLTPYGGLFLIRRVLFGNFFYYFWTYAAWMIAFGFVGRLQREAHLQRQHLELIQSNIDAQNSMLKYQIRPHFLFNALNALLALVLDHEWTRGREVVRALSKLLRESFRPDVSDFLPIVEQLNALETYLSIEKVRFGDRLRFRIVVPPELGCALAPSLILQPLIENAMKHAVGAASSPVDVEMTASRSGPCLMLRVHDTGGDPEARRMPGFGIGLRNVRARLAGHYGEAASLRCEHLTPRGFMAEIRLPLEFT